MFVQFVECVGVREKGREPTERDEAQQRGQFSLPGVHTNIRYYAYSFECGLALEQEGR